MQNSYFGLDYSTSQSGVTNIYLNRPDKLNSMAPKFWTDFPKLLADLDAKGDTRVAILRGNGRHFSAGLDLSSLTKSEISSSKVGRARELFTHTVDEMQHTFSMLEQTRFPVIAAVHGACIGGAVDMVTACDMIYAAADSFFCIQETNIGLVADVGTLQRLPYWIGAARTKELAYTARRLKAQEACEFGLVASVYENTEQLYKQVEEKAHAIAKQSPLVISGIKKVVNYSRDHSVKDSLEYVALWNSGMMQASDIKIGIEASMNKTEPEYDNLGEIKSFSQS